MGRFLSIFSTDDDDARDFSITQIFDFLYDITVGGKYFKRRGKSSLKNLITVSSSSL